MERNGGLGPKQISCCPCRALGQRGGTWKKSGSPAGKYSKKGWISCPLVLLWRLHYVVMID